MVKIILGSPIRPIEVGEPALIHKEAGLMRTGQVVTVNRISASEIRFETQNSQYVLRVVPVKEVRKAT